ncbi:MAG: CoA activase [Deltaproteobacteria bacterium]|jgi:predicted CoA-substrate-specific enzyme activase|nr:CoA activase [Deltaproteobacteria bacterium]MBW2533962.1 CoA activase [Deltaproteobacteria bacterium]
MSERFVGIDVGAETIKLVELTRVGDQLRWTRRERIEHHKEPALHLRQTLSTWHFEGVAGAAACGRLSRPLALERIPEKQARAAGYRHLFSEDEPATLVSIGSHGFSVLELRGDDVEIFRENSRCSQGTGNFLRQLVERFDLAIDEASEICARVDDPAPLSGRCPVILKTDMTHLANHGQSRSRILAGLYDAVAENVQVLIKPRLSPRRVMLLGGVSRSERIREHFRRFLERADMELVTIGDDESLFLDALGCAALAANQHSRAVPSLEALVGSDETVALERVPALADSLSRVRRMSHDEVSSSRPSDEHAALPAGPLILGFDIGSTGSKAVALDPQTLETAWQGYISTNGNPVGAAQQLTAQFLDSECAGRPVVALGATGSGREIVGSLLTTCYGHEPVFVLNEIAAHAAGALHYDERVDTIFEIGGQDAKYIRLDEGRVVDAAMNEACSAGTGSFIEEQGRRFAGIRDVVHLGAEALEAGACVSLGQHCSVFMAEIIDEAVGAGEARREIIAGIYDSVIQNYLNRVKGTRSVGQVVFCQGMPFASDALAAAVARQTGAEVVIPPDPGTIGALGIALLTRRERLGDRALPTGAAAAATEIDRQSVDLRRFLGAEVLRRDTFVCKATQGCGGAGNKCRIDRIHTLVGGEKQKFTWGGGCSLWDRGTGKTKLPDGAPDPFREREELIAKLLAELGPQPGKPTLAMTDEFLLKSLFPFFATFLHQLGFDLAITHGADQQILKRGIEEANVPFCAPMQQYHGLVSSMVDEQPDLLFLPMLRTMPRVAGEEHSVLCPIVQGSADMLKADLGTEISTRLLSPVIDVGRSGLESEEFVASCASIADELGIDEARWRPAFDRALAAQQRFDRRCLELGQRAIDFCAEHGIVPLVVLGRAYTIYNQVLNSNVPAIVREQGAIPIPVDCYPIADEVPVFEDIYWGYAQRNLRAAHQIRRTPGTYSLWCSNYACGPDSFGLHFYAYIMEGKPYAVIETDGHSGDAGTKTRVEAFLYCVKQDLARTEPGASPRRFKLIENEKDDFEQIRRRKERVLVPRMGPGADACSAALRACGIPAETLPRPNREALALGRRYTSGKECVPMTITLGSLLQRLEEDRDSDELFSFFMPTANGPCRFGVYNLLHKITLERLGWKDRVRVWSPQDDNYFNGVPGGFSVLLFIGFMAYDLLQEAFYDVRPAETEPGAARRILDEGYAELSELIERAGETGLELVPALGEVANGRLYGVTELLERYARRFAAVKRRVDLPSVLVVGEIYVRCDVFANDFVIDRLEDQGIRVRFAPFNEWIEYVDVVNRTKGIPRSLGDWLTSHVVAHIQRHTYATVGRVLGWPRRTYVKDSIEAAAPYIRKELNGEAVITLGGPLHEWHEGIIDGVLSAGPLECMPSKIAEAQFFHAAEREGLLSITLSVNGDPVDPEVLDSFIFEVKERHRKRRAARGGDRDETAPRASTWWADLGRRVGSGLVERSCRAPALMRSWLDRRRPATAPPAARRPAVAHPRRQPTAEPPQPTAPTSSDRPPPPLERDPSSVESTDVHVDP